MTYMVAALVGFLGGRLWPGLTSLPTASPAAHGDLRREAWASSPTPSACSCSGAGASDAATDAADALMMRFMGILASAAPRFLGILVVFIITVLALKLLGIIVAPTSSPLALRLLGIIVAPTSSPKSSSGRPSAETDSPPQAVRSIAVQSQTTYTFRCTNPRFTVLAATCHGSFVE